MIMPVLGMLFRNSMPFPVKVLVCLQVAACICLFALDKHEAIPVDTHVWQLAVRYYTPHLKGIVSHLTTECSHFKPGVPPVLLFAARHSYMSCPTLPAPS